MTLQTTTEDHRPFAFIMAALAMATVWLPTVSAPTPDAAHADPTVIVMAAPAPYTPPLM